jgi:multidrug efflux pump subunit AcrA (membrane-fusion protein)
MTGFRGLVAIVMTASLIAAVWVGARQFVHAERSELPIAPVRSGEFVAVIRTRGQIQAQRSVPIYAPLVQDLRIAWMAPASERIERGAPLIRFDSSTVERDLIQRRATAERARAALDLAIADGKAAAEHDQRDLQDARLAVELAQLDTKDSEFVARLDAERGRIDLRVAEQKLRQLEAEVKQRAASRESKIASLQRQLATAEGWVRIVEARISQMEISAPISGFALYAANRSSLSSQLSGGAEQPYRVGNPVASGMNLATIPDLSSLLIDATVEEIDRGRMRIGDEVIVRVDALPDVSMQAKLTAISPMAEMSLDSRGRSFHAYAALGDKSDPRVRPGMNGTLDIVTRRIPGATIIPAKALFTRNGKPTVHLVEGDDYRTVEVEVLARNSDEIAVKGVESGARVTLVDPLAEGSGDDSGGGTAGNVK